jgi:AAA+ superfamily predicted ATPase
MTTSKGILKTCKLPDKSFDDLWERIIVPQDIKDRLIAQILLSFTVRKKIPFGALPVHGLILLVGPPGTGKTSLAKAVASKASAFFKGAAPKFLQVEPHSLTSSSLGRSQRDVHEFLTATIAEHASHGPLIVLLDEVETMAVDRKQLSLDANPVDVHRATDAVLAALDHLAEQHPDLLFIATSNFEQALDAALISRADLVERIDKPSAEACSAILDDTLQILQGEWPKIGALRKDRKFKDAAKSAVGLDGRQIRKAVLHACAANRDIASDPNLLTLEHVTAALINSKRSLK